MDVVAAVGMFRDGRDDGGLSISAGSVGFWIVVALILVLVVLYRSMRKQIRRIDFDEDATTDQERMGRAKRNTEGG
ncbi:hypothetical protein G1H11_08050 [Phytoactinopolyspora alkaliphila]|uniref:Uncharacterized protein n=1 Tax=Phytoactinopolyspora alkaliphila TaxID=1783498 RepID=A0A6N9YJS8_9ACTN|nr:hypothetical protein [Phytoactinopolyspora alkaliphila]NED95266.1 hypothetical protein [Phytoactinopolyspora alkaliphila]